MSDVIKRYCFDHDFEQVVEKATGAFVHVSDVVAMVREVQATFMLRPNAVAAEAFDIACAEILRRLGEEP